MAFKDDSILLLKSSVRVAKKEQMQMAHDSLTTMLIALTASILLLVASSALTWVYPQHSATPELSLALPILAIIIANIPHSSGLLAFVTLLAFGGLAAPTLHEWISVRQLPAIEALLPLVLVLCAAGFLWWHPRRRYIDVEEFKQALHLAPAGLLITDRNGIIINANEKVARMWEYPALNLTGMNLAALDTNTLWPRLLEHTEKLLQGEAVEFEFELDDEDGQEQNHRAHAHIARDERGRANYFVIQIEDLAKEQAAQRSLQLASRQIRRILSNSSDMVLVINHRLQITYANDVASAMLTSSSDVSNAKDLVGKPIYNYIRDSHRKRFMRAFEAFAIKERNESQLTDIALPGANEASLSAHIIRLSEATDSGFAIILQTNAEQLQVLEQNKMSQARFSQVFHGSPDAILIMRASDALILDFNDGFTRLLGYEREHAIGETNLDYRFWNSIVERDQINDRLRREREIIDYETTLKTRSGEAVHVEISLRYVEIDNELCILCIGRDITKRISAEAALIETEEKFEKVFTQSPDGIVIVKRDDVVITDANDAFLNRSGFSREELMGKSLLEFNRVSDPQIILTIADELNREGMFTNHAITFIAKDGEKVPTLSSGTLVELSGESYVMVISKDISKQQATEERLRRSEERFRGIFENAPIGIMLVDLEGRINNANRTAAELLAYDELAMQGVHISRIVPAEERSSLKDSVTKLTVGEIESYRAERRVICQNGLEIWTNFNMVLQKDGHGEPLYYIVQIADISDVKRSQQRMEQMAFYDTLTNLANRRLFQDRLNQSIQHAVRTDRASALLYLDLDNFKRVNDTLGHETGDNLLKEVASRLQQCVRKEDTVGRTGGDEFTILLNEVGTPTDAGMIAQKILNHLREPIQVSGHPLIVTTSIGITVIPSDGLDPNVLMRNADLAMYKAKERGRNNYQFYSEDLNTNAVKRLRTEYEIRQALERKEFELYYQPKISIADNEIVGVESLVRWNHPERGLLAPDEFIGIAEDTGSIIDLGSWIIEEACRASKILSQCQRRPIQVAINISPRQFRDPNLVTTVRRGLREAQMDPEHIELEITETMLMQDVEAAQATVVRLSELGVKIAIDDFGTGYSSLNYLKRFPINTVKVDRSFVMDIPGNTDDMAITRAVIAMAHQLKMEVVAEGVETKAQLQFLAEQRCEYAQGWLFSKARPLDEIVQLIQSNAGIIHVA
jgi:diguanylate cyclase (GGDEF)-like protein/PAS domain S-box-containing protein